MTERELKLKFMTLLNYQLMSIQDNTIFNIYGEMIGDIDNLDAIEKDIKRDYQYYITDRNYTIKPLPSRRTGKQREQDERGRLWRKLNQ